MIVALRLKREEVKKVGSRIVGKESYGINFGWKLIGAKYW